MFCGHCGKRVNDDMRFCPFCGREIIIPDQSIEEHIQGDTSGKRERPVSIFDIEDEATEENADVQSPDEDKTEETEFSPLNLDADEIAEDADAQEEPAESILEAQSDDHEDTTLNIKQEFVPPARERPRMNTYTPVKEITPDELFFEDEEEYDAPDEDEFDDEDFEIDFEEKEKGSFLNRHIRGFVALILLLLVVIICLAFSTTGPGQKILAKMNVAWKPEAYAELGMDAYNAGSYSLGQKYFTRALSLENDNYDYAHNAMVCAYKDRDMDTVKAMMLKCAELDPDNERGIRDEIRGVYPSAETRPFEIEEILNTYESSGKGGKN